MYKPKCVMDSKCQVETSGENFPKNGLVTEKCQEWMVREDGALAYRLQDQEINAHYSGNKMRNQVVREDFPKAKVEQLREQQMAVQAAQMYRRMLDEQSVHDKEVARQLAHRIEEDERRKQRAIESRDQELARKMLDRERIRVERRHEKPMRDATLYVDPFVQVTDIDEVIDQVPGLSIGTDRDLDERERQERCDAELARRLQEQENSECNRDRLLAIEAQDKELAKLLQERERLKARKAREKAKQKSQQKKQQLSSQTTTTTATHAVQIPLSHDTTNALSVEQQDTYSMPLDSLTPCTDDDDYNRIQSGFNANGYPVSKHSPTYAIPEHSNSDINAVDYEHNSCDNYSLPADSLSVIRPADLDLQTHVVGRKPRYPDPPGSNSPTGSYLVHANIAMAIDPTYPRRSGPVMPLPTTGILPNTPIDNGLLESEINSKRNSVSSSSSKMPITSSSTHHHPLHNGLADIHDDLNSGPVPPYMPIQGQRRPNSLSGSPINSLPSPIMTQSPHEKVKPKKKSIIRDSGNCKQQ